MKNTKIYKQYDILNYMKYTLLLVFTLFLCLTLVSAETQDLGYIKTNDCITLVQSYCNSTYSNVSSIQLPNKTLLHLDLPMTKTGCKYSLDYCNNSQNGQYIVSTVTDVDGTPVEVSYTYNVNPSGSQTNTYDALFYIGILLILISILAYCVISIFKSDNMGWVVAFISAAYILLISVVFMLNQILINFLPTLPFIGGLFSILQTILLVGLLPLFIGEFLYLMYRKVAETEIKDMINMGYSEKEAHDRRKK